MEKYVPDAYKESIYQVNYDLLYSKGITCLLFDLDNTLVSPNAKTPTEEVKKLLNNLKEKFEVIIFSNGQKKRVKEFITDLDIDYVYSAHKPSPCSFLEVMKKYKKNETQVAIIGDQLMTDVKGGNNIGITTVLVKPVCSYDPFFTKINRLREKRMFKKLRKYNLFKGRFYDEKM